MLTEAMGSLIEVTALMQWEGVPRCQCSLCIYTTATPTPREWIGASGIAGMTFGGGALDRFKLYHKLADATVLGQVQAMPYC